jgi:hypothetical protein
LIDPARAVFLLEPFFGPPNANSAREEIHTQHVEKLPTGECTSQVIENMVARDGLSNRRQHCQIDIQIPSGVTNGDDVPVQITILGASDTATTSIQVRAN